MQAGGELARQEVELDDRRAAIVSGDGGEADDGAIGIGIPEVDELTGDEAVAGDVDVRVIRDAGGREDRVDLLAETLWPIVV